MILEGEERRAAENYLVDMVKMMNLRSAPAGEVKIQVDFHVDADGILTYEIIEIGTENTIKMQYEPLSFNLPIEVVESWAA
mmetsp:Transcript_39997/g.52346  ORF Transcript_39997/g.52346 Transcript_39997/m.52346 type:complete len:81 (+) Transcript_39997:1425-1667(+)|eukprot:CAMPEP_0185571464 /NCGR_PEP_ID=MMETSP0434-20130131/3509_1 /TAXON_ID=626734 ORGANISM="Favella taraikaensis, Strain Fe Narragansett Bay" /NCGR_SAMPLE_ID=MMETSP0434 /ASSEMBLY_ACC=CAM_ASM_000379 /LENGTH=80 /DNA_ID=CAMNT_0028186911 /DNA_START=1359 /DNA_END=1601 /DNA_ORIENTATION=+